MQVEQRKTRTLIDSDLGKESKRKNEYIDLGSKTTSNPNPRAKGGGYSPSAANTAGHRCAEKSRAAARRGAAQRGSDARRPGRRRYERARARGTAAKPFDGGALPHGRSARAGEGVDGGASHASSAVAVAIVSCGRRRRRGERRGRERNGLGFHGEGRSPGFLFPRGTRTAVGSRSDGQGAA